MAHLTSFFVLAFALFFYSVGAAPLGQSYQKRQIGNLQCNIARLQTVGGLSKSTKAIQTAIKAAGSDSATVSQLQTAAQGISSAQDGVKTIAEALLTLQQAPAAARQQVASGLTAASSALSSVSSSDSAVTSAVSAAQSAVSSTTSAGQKVVADCK